MRWREHKTNIQPRASRFFFVRLSGKAAGKQEARQEINEAESVARKEARNVENETASMADTDITNELKSD